MDIETRTLKCVLTQDERAALLDTAARMTCEDKLIAVARVDTIAGQLKSAKACVEAVQATIDAKLDIANRGWESRQVECHWRIDRTAQLKRLVRSDTGEVVETVTLPAQQTIAGLVESTPAVRDAPELDGVIVGLCGTSPDGVPYQVSATAADSVVVVHPDGTTQRVAAADWPAWEPNPDIDSQEYVDAWEDAHAAAEGETVEPGYVPIEGSERGQAVLRALDREGKTLTEIFTDSGTQEKGLRDMLALFVERGLVVVGTRATKRGKPPTTWSITPRGEEVIA